jgi:molybdate/tungstate transport system substrate-binding protein
MLDLAEKYYNAPGLKQSVLANAPLANIRDTETALIAWLQLGQIDYLAIYRSDALQHHLKFLDLPANINLSDPAHADFYQQGVARTKNGLSPADRSSMPSPRSTAARTPTGRRNTSPCCSGRRGRR